MKEIANTNGGQSVQSCNRVGCTGQAADGGHEGPGCDISALRISVRSTCSWSVLGMSCVCRQGAPASGCGPRSDCCVQEAASKKS